MKQKAKSGLAYIVGWCLLMVSCAEFPTDFNWVESGKIRVLDFIYEPTEAAPGDTVTLLAVFAGDSIAPTDVIWNVSYKLSGTLTSLGNADSVVPLIYEQLDTSFSENTFTVGIRFQIPPDVMKESDMIPEDWVSFIPEDYIQYIPPEFLAMTKTDFINLIETFKNEQIPDDIAPFIPIIMQMMTIKIRFFADVKGKLPVESDYTVRYNRYFADVPKVGLNTNPAIHWIGVYKVKGENLQSFDKATDTYEFFRLYGSEEGTVSDTIVVDKGYTYFVAAESGNFDSVYSLISMDTTQPPKDSIETHFFGWFFQYNENEIANVAPYDLMDIASATGGDVEILYPPKDKRVKTFTLWTQCYDYYLSERYRPTGSSLKEVSGVFRYTDAYIKLVNDK